MTSGLSPDDDDDDDSIYSGDVLPDPTSSAADETVLDPSCTQTKQLDKGLDDDDAQHLRDNPHLVDSDYDSDNVRPSDDSDEDDKPAARATHVEVLPSPPPYPDAPGLDDDLQVCAEGLGSVASITGRFEKTMHVSPRSDNNVDGSEGVVVLDANDEDDWFDSDENEVEVESLESSDASTDVALDDAKAATPNPRHGPTPQKESWMGRTDRVIESSQSEKQRPSGGGAYSLLSRASQTFYKAFKKTSKKSAGTSTSTGASAGSRWVGGVGAGENGVRTGMEDTMRHDRIIQLLEAQIATLNGARTGFVDLNLLKPMTEKTVEAIDGEAKMLVGDYLAVENRAREVEKEARKAVREAEGELEAKEQILIDAKVRLAEASAEVDGLRHELRRLQKSLEAPERVEAGVREERRKRREGMDAELVAGREARVAAEERLEGQKRRLKMEQGQLDRLEKGYRDIEGDWA